ncbi:HNH endonuclease signature motif containing protein [Allobranchiibius sp. GilTou38]|uniref:HNH endonuclease signature motif containing protein n=1 Tax=Allobranchiibius sp. GilTou38 TaxID=2815210 RepID=UPI001AA11F59|nr:HNH endonuclease signature motif containing protein [Allobranchiibius sp. GilTou38]MBO1765675.1 DUF222 domain-containing protein [Allobranchiibius sp. GilTou38]
MSSNAAVLTPPDPRTTLSRVVGRLNSAHADLVSLVAQVIDDDSWALSGISSPEHWLTCYAGLTHGDAARVTGIARRTRSLPGLARGLDDGELSIGQAAVIAKYTPDGFDDSVVELARHATVTQLRRALARYEFAPAAPEPDSPPKRHDPFDPSVARPQLSMQTRDGRFHLTYDAPADIGALVQQSIVEAKDALFLAGQPHITMADALTEVATRFLERGAELSGGRSGKFRTYLHLDTAGRGWVTKGSSLPQHLLRKWSCDGLVQPVWETQGSPVNVGRTQRIVPRRTRRLVEDRDGGCRHPGCFATHHVECHHVTHWADGGDTDMNGLISRCPYHHDRHHSGDFHIEPVLGHPGQFRFLDRSGVTLGPVPGVPLDPGTEDDVTPYRGASGEALYPDWVRFRPNPTAAEIMDVRRLWALAAGTGEPPDLVVPEHPDPGSIESGRPHLALARVDGMSDDTPQHPIPDELKIDVDQDKLDKWDAVSEEYAGEGDEEKHRPVFTDDSTTTGRETDGSSQDQAGDATGIGIRDDQERPDEDEPDQAATDA